MKKEETIKLTKTQYKKLTSKVIEQIKEDVKKNYPADDAIDELMFATQTELTYMLAYAQLGKELFK